MNNKQLTINKQRIIKSAKDTIKIEAAAVRSLMPKINDSFVKAVELILHCRGRIVVTGIGKSGVIGRKISATFASTGTPSFFIHSSEGGHGDLGMLTADDIVMPISYSGETPEVSSLLPAFKRLGISIITITGNPGSTLAKYSDVVLNVNIKREACPMNLAPTSSTTAILAMGDAIAVALINEKKFTSKQFALFHPSGHLGKMLLLKVEDIMHTNDELPLIESSMPVKDAVYVISSKRLGITGIINKTKKLIGSFSDGDLRRLIQKDVELLNQPLHKFINGIPKTISKEALAAEALFIMNKFKITSLFIINKHKQPIGITHMHDILQSGIR